MAANLPTKLKKIEIRSFRGLKDVTIDFADRITLICGKNGTSKSSILGIAAQVFSFRKDYVAGTTIDNRTLAGERFESTVSDHFRLSKIFDPSGSMDTEIFIYDAYSEKEEDFNLRLYDYRDRALPRPIVRGNSSATGNTSRNATHPVIYLSLNRLTPISLRSKYSAHSISYLEDHKKEFVALNQELLGKYTTANATATTGSINSIVVHGDNYDQDSVSAGEDNVGQIVQAIFSFKKLKQEYANYRGGLLLIDEADAGLFPAAQNQLLKILNREAKALNLQVIMTSHSPTMIEQIYSTTRNANSDNKIIYLSDTYGSISIFENFSWPQIFADLHEKTVKLSAEVSLPVINIYFEDKETSDFFNALVKDRKVRKTCNLLSEVTFGCDEYKKLIDRKVPEFSSKSIIILDGDVPLPAKYTSMLQLPGTLPPEQLIFEFLYNLPPADDFWKNSTHYTRNIFIRNSDKIINELSIDRSNAILNLTDTIKAYKNNGQQKSVKLRRIFKDEFAHDKDFLDMVKGKVSENPYRYWAKNNSDAAELFSEIFIRKLKSVLASVHGIDRSHLAALD